MRRDQRQIALQGGFEQIFAALEHAAFLALGQLRADPGGGVEPGNAGAGGAHAFRQSALRVQLKLDLIGLVKRVEDVAAGRPRIGADHLAHTAGAEQRGQALGAAAGVVGDHRQIGRALVDQGVNQIIGQAGVAEPADQHGGTIGRALQRGDHVVANLIDRHQTSLIAFRSRLTALPKAAGDGKLATEKRAVKTARDKGKTTMTVTAGAGIRALFDLPEDIAYLDCAAQGPLLRASHAAGARGLLRKFHPWTPDGRPSTAMTAARDLFAGLIGARGGDIAHMGATSYGAAVAGANMTIEPGQKVLVLEAQFPSIIVWQRLAAAMAGR